MSTWTRAHVVVAFAFAFAGMLSGCASDASIDFGKPSTDYPASHAALPSARNNGGPVQIAPAFYSVTVAGDPLAAPLADFLSRVGTSRFWGPMQEDYGVGPPRLAGVVTIPAPAATIDHAMVAGMLDAMLDGTHPEYGTPSLDTDYVIVLPDGVTIQNPGGTSCRNFFAYHGSFAISAGPFAGTEVTYAAIPRCPAQSAGFGTQLDELTFAISHEIVEAASDPLDEDGHPAWGSFDPTALAWNLLDGGEIADMCGNGPDSPAIKPDDLGYMVQRYWSKAQAATSHDPCQPTSETYFGAAPALSEVTAIPGLRDRVMAAIIPVGSSGEIELDLFSDAPTSGPISVGAVDAAQEVGLPRNLRFTFDRSSGVNGEKVHLKVHVDSAGTGWGYGNAEFLLVTAAQGGRNHVWPVMIANDP